jgi:hypothetical protein
MQQVAMHHATKTMGEYASIQKEESIMLNIDKTDNVNKEPPRGCDFSRSGDNYYSPYIRVSFPNHDERPTPYIMEIEHTGSP